MLNLAGYFLRIENRKQAAFTLAEVLITLAIIGVVAALTIPSLVNKYKERQRITQLKKTYAVLNQAFQFAYIEHGAPSKWSLTKTDTGMVDSDGNPIYDKEGMNIVSVYLSKYLRSAGTNIFTFDSMKGLNGVYSKRNTTKLEAGETDPGIILADGTFVRMGWVNNTACDDNKKRCSDIMVYLPEKNQQVGVTLFYFYLTEKGIVPAGEKDDDIYSFEANCNVKNSSISTSYSGRGCTAWAIQKGNMDYLRCNDLSWDGNDKCQ